jgi:hypothetical protein
MSSEPRVQFAIYPSDILVKGVGNEEGPYEGVWAEVTSIWDGDNYLEFERFSHLSGLSLAVEVYAEILGTFRNSDMSLTFSNGWEYADGNVFIRGDISFDAVDPNNSRYDITVTGIDPILFLSESLFYEEDQEVDESDESDDSDYDESDDSDDTDETDDSDESDYDESEEEGYYDSDSEYESDCY